MKHGLYLIPLFISFVLIGPSATAQQAEIGPFLQDALADTQPDERLDVIIYMKATADLSGLKRRFESEHTPVADRPKAVMRLLKNTAYSSRKDLMEFLESSPLPYANIRGFWIANAVAVEALPAQIQTLASRSDISRIILNRRAFAYNDPPMRELGTPKSAGGSEQGLVAVGAAEMWAMGYTGRGRVAMTFDTGIWDDHPAHRDRYLGNRMPYTSTWFGYDNPIPIDKSSSHGTHVTGIMLGLDTATNDTIGMAPEAYFIATDPVVSNLANVKPLTDFMFGYEWALNPDGDEETSHDVPDVINNSWGFGPELDEAPCPEFVIPVFTALETAGIANVFSAGNEGPGDMTISVPHNTNIGLVNSFTVGATNAYPPHPIATFSSRGPSICGGEGSLLIKPEVSAPGIGIRSSVERGNYDVFSGTSMAAPHVSGAVLLLKEAFPFLSGEELLLALYYSATDLGEEGEDNTYGMGMIDVKAAFDLLAETHTPVAPQASGVDLELVEITEPNFEVLSCTTDDSLTVIPSILIHNRGSSTVSNYTVRYGFEDGVEQSMTFSQPLAPDAYVALQLPPMTDGQVGTRGFHAYIVPLDDEYDIWNNHRMERWINLAKHDWETQGPFVENFDNGLDSTVWEVHNPDGAMAWDTLVVVQSDGTMGVAAHMDHYHYYPNFSQVDHLISPLISNMPLENQILSFDYFYRRREMNPFTFDTLAVTLTRACGDPYPGEVLYVAGGEGFFTVEGSQHNAMPEDATQWQTVSLDLDLVSDEPFYFSFVTTNRNGNNLLIDNIRIDNGTGTENSPPARTVDLYPNPSSAWVRATWRGGPATVTMFDATGRAIEKWNDVASDSRLEWNAAASGVYALHFDWPDGRRTISKLVIR